MDWDLAEIIDRDRILGRIDASLTNHYLSLEITVVSVALAMAGLARADLLAEPVSPGSRLALLWLVWVGGLLAIAVAYAGPMIGAFALPPSIPTVLDLLPPLAIGVVEFLMFAVLIRQVGPGTRFDLVIATWLWVMAAFGIIAFVTILRAQYLLLVGVMNNQYESEVRDVVLEYLKYLGTRVWGPIPLVAFSTTAASLWSNQIRYNWLAFTDVLIIDFLLAAALTFHVRTARFWRKNLGIEPKRRPSVLQLVPKLRIGPSSKTTVSASRGESAES